MIYTPQYFIDKFSAIPAEYWCIGDYTKGVTHCALGHCGYKWSEGQSKIIETEEGKALLEMVPSVVDINDNVSQAYPGENPKERVLAALELVQRCGVK